MSVYTPRMKVLWLALAALVLLRLISLGLYPVMETTEARYAEIARLMIESHDWITPWFDYGVPFWGKPPASFWLSAVSMQIFGINEFAARLPHLIGGLGIGYLTWLLAQQRSTSEAVYAPVLLGGSLLFFVSAGAVMTDITLVIGTTLTLYGFWQGIQGAGRAARLGRWLLFVGLAIGLLAKGPIALILSGFPLGVWTLWQARNGLLGRVWRVFPWLRGTLLLLALTLPWYLLAEQKTPGFLHYFIIGEHWNRFVQSGWAGDLYGTAHAYPRGTIWLFGIAALAPWVFLFPLGWLRWCSRMQAMPQTVTDRAWRDYLIIWALTPCLFFTLAGNVIMPYVLPALPAAALLGAGWLVRRFSERHASRLLLIGLAFSGVVATLALIQLERMDRAGSIKSTKALIAMYENQHGRNDALVYLGKRPFSATFYLGQSIQRMDNDAALLTRLGQGKVFALVETSEIPQLQAMTPQRLLVLGRTGKWSLLTMPASASH